MKLMLITEETYPVYAEKIGAKVIHDFETVENCFLVQENDGTYSWSDGYALVLRLGFMMIVQPDQL